VPRRTAVKRECPRQARVPQVMQKCGNQPAVWVGAASLRRMANRVSVLRSHVGPLGWKREDR
jgi:hypothetical protein